MSSPALGSFSRSFPLAPDVLKAGSSATVSASATTSADVLGAIANNTPFPTRPNGRIELGQVALEAEAGKDLTFHSGKGAVGFSASFGVNTGVGVYDVPGDALSALELEEAPGVDLTIADDAATRFLLMRWGYQVSGSVSATHPIGAVGSVTFGAQASRAALYAVLHRFSNADGAADVLQRTVTSWRLPRQIGKASQLAPSTWVIAETEGSLALRLAAKVGYDFSFLKQAKLAGLSGNIGLKIDAGASAFFGFHVSGRYLVMLGRESNQAASETLRLRLFKLSRNGINFGLNVTVGVTGQTGGLLPDKSDDFVKAVFGVHGLQAVKVLGKLEQWTDPAEDLSKLLAGFANKHALDLIQSVTGIDPAVEFDKARGLLLGVIRKWDALPGRVSASLWRSLEDMNPAAVKRLEASLKLLASTDPLKRKKAFDEILSGVNFASTPAGQFLVSIADRGVLALSGRLEEVGTSAKLVLEVLDGGLLKKLQGELESRLGLDQVRKVLTANDFKKLDGLLVNRLAAFLDKEALVLQDLDEIRAAINVVIAKRHEIYDKALKALNSRYSFEFASRYERTTTRTALIDAAFDLSKPEAAALLAEVLDGGYDRALVEEVPGVVLNGAVLTHELNTKSSVEVNLPKFNFQKEHSNVSLARVFKDTRTEVEGSRVLVYEVNAEDRITVRNRFRSSLSAGLSLGLLAGTSVRLHSRESMSMSYRLLHARKNMRREDLIRLTRPFIQDYMPSKFAAADLSTWYTEFDRTVENVVHNGPNEFGDVFTTMEVTVPGSALAAWLLPRDEAQHKAAKMEMSRQIQRTVRRLLPFYYFQDVGHLRQNASAAALLVWAAMKPSTSVSFVDGQIKSLNTDKDVYWNFPDKDLRKAMARSAGTAVQLVAPLLAAQARLLEVGDSGNADFFVPSETADFQLLASGDTGDILLNGLCFFEAELVGKASDALDDARDAMSQAAAAPEKAIEALAEFGSNITRAFHEKVSSVYGKDSLRSLGQMVFLEASRSLDPLLCNVTPSAMLSLTVLKEESSFPIASFLDGNFPPEAEVATGQQLVATTA
ncbi:MAG: hypothetical protein JJE04_13825 [Acidobacteriia bacterium]|nr:hypothetical protein [Terriglobia bacterium]